MTERRGEARRGECRAMKGGCGEASDGAMRGEARRGECGAMKGDASDGAMKGEARRGEARRVTER